DHLVLDVRRDAVQVARLHRLLLVADGEDRPARQPHPHLLVRVRVLLDDAVRLQFDQRHHQLLQGARLDVHPGEDGVPAALLGRREVRAHFSSPLLASWAWPSALCRMISDSVPGLYTIVPPPPFTRQLGGSTELWIMSMRVLMFCTICTGCCQPTPAMMSAT